MQTVYHDRLQMSFCSQCTLLWKWFGQWKREEKYNKDKKGKLESLSLPLSILSFSHSLSLMFPLFLSPPVVCNRCDGNWFPGELFFGPFILKRQSYFPPLSPAGHCPFAVCLPKTDCFNCSFQFPLLFSPRPSGPALNTTFLSDNWFPDR